MWPESYSWLAGIWFCMLDSPHSINYNAVLKAINSSQGERFSVEGSLYHSLPLSPFSLSFSTSFFSSSFFFLFLSRLNMSRV